MGTERRQVLAFLAALAVCPVGQGRAAGAERRLYLGARNDAAGGHHASAFDAAGAPWLDLAVPWRGHAFAVHPRRPEAVLFPRRPGRTAQVIDLARGIAIATIEAAPGRHFCGHGVYAGDGGLLWAAEEAGDEGRGVLGRYAPDRGYRRDGEVSTHGVGPHEVTLLGDARTLVVANGGILTHPDAPGVKLGRDRMRPTLAVLDGRDGRLLDEGRLAEPLWRLSLRHLAVGRGDRVAVAAQDEGDPGDLLPLVAVWRRRVGIELLEAGPSLAPRMAGYCGAAAVDAAGTLLAASCPRGGLAVFWDLETSRVIGSVDLADGCGLAPTDRAGTFLLTSGRGGAAWVEPAESRTTPLASRFVTDARWDNHVAVATARLPRPAQGGAR